MVPWLRIELNNFSYTGISVSILAFIISFLILSENGDLIFFNFSAALIYVFLFQLLWNLKDESVDNGIYFVVAHCKCFAALG